MPEIDRNSKGPGNHLGGRLFVTLIASAIVMILIMTMIIIPALLRGDPLASNVPARQSYTIHPTISIDGNLDFSAQAAAEFWSGDGSPGDPYIIANYDIDASSIDGISIQNTNVYFTIIDCYLHDGSLSNCNGIFLSNCMNATLNNNTCSYNYDGIALYSSSNNTLSNNNCSSNDWIGILVSSSDDSSSNGNILRNNNCSNNAHGIDLYSSNNNTLDNNTCRSNNVLGISLDSSSNNNTLDNNTCSSNNVLGITLGSSSNNMLGNNTCNSNDFIGIDLYLSNYSTLINNNCSSNNGYGGIRLASSNNNTLINNIFWNNGFGMTFCLSNSTIVSWNELCNNTLQGIYILSGSTNWIWNNTFINNNGAGSVFNVSQIQAYDNSTNNWWNSTDGYGNWWSDWRAPDDNWDGIVDNPYNISGSTGAKDYHPQTIPGTPIPEPSILILAGVMMMIFLIIGRTRKKP